MKYMQKNVPSKCITHMDNKQYFWIYDYCMQILFEFIWLKQLSIKPIFRP